jgi:hypothetical protein
MAAPALAAPPIENIVLVHGAFVEGSCRFPWEACSVRVTVAP